MPISVVAGFATLAERPIFSTMIFTGNSGDAIVLSFLLLSDGIAVSGSIGMDSGKRSKRASSANVVQKENMKKPRKLHFRIHAFCVHRISRAAARIDHSILAMNTV